jgi:hypothetical protein
MLLTLSESAHSPIWKTGEKAEKSIQETAVIDDGGITLPSNASKGNTSTFRFAGKCGM